MRYFLQSGRKALGWLLVLMAVVLSTSASVSAQKKEGNHGKGNFHKEMREFRIKYVAQEIELRDDQRKEFLEVYTKMLDERRDAFAEVRRLDKAIKEKKTPAEADYKALTDAKNKAASRIVEIDRKYDEMFSKFLSQKQIVKMKDAEEKFRKRMMEMQRDKKGKGHGK